MGWCSFVLLLMVTILHGNLSSTPLDDPTINMNLNESPNDPPFQERGRQTDKKRKRILGGTRYYPPGHPVAADSGVPDWEHWTASLRVKKSGKKSGKKIYDLCGGVLITEQHVLTALHCITEEPSNRILQHKDVEIFFDPVNVQKWKGMKFAPIGFYYMNMPDVTVELLDNGKTKDDIVLIKMNMSVTDPRLPTNNLQPITRSKQDAKYTITNQDGTNNLWTAGWGLFLVPRYFPQFLRYTSLTSKRCKPNPFHKIEIQDTQICFASTKDSAICQGDSGSPGVVRIYDPPASSSNPVWHLQSITLRGPPCRKLGNMSRSVHIDVHQYEADIDYWMTLP